MATKNKKTFEVEIDGKKVEISVLRPNHKVTQSATLVYNRAFREAVETKDGQQGVLVRSKIESIMRDQNLWDDAKQNRYEEILKELLAGERRLTEGGFKQSEAKAIAINMRRWRNELRNLFARRNELDAFSAESLAEQARFNFMVANLVYLTDGKLYFKDVDDYLSRDEKDPVVLPAAQALGEMLYGLDEDFASKLPENKFLVKYGHVNKDLHLIRKKDGHLINADGKLVDDKGRLVNEQNELVDADGNLLTESGEYKVDFKEFIDDEVEAESELVSSAQ